MRKAIRQISMLVSTVRYCSKTKQAGQRKQHIGWRNAFRICLTRKFDPREAYYLGFFDGDFNEATLDCYVSRRELTKMQERVNPPSWADLLKNKGIFYRFCAANDVPVPSVYALFFSSSGGILSDGRSLRARSSEWAQYLMHELPQTFVFKPARGSNGDGVCVFERSDKDFVGADGRIYNTDAMWRLMCSETFRTGLIIQERLFNHEDLALLTASRFLQTIRVCTFVDAGGLPDILHAHLKLTARDAAIDNFGVGLSGSLQCCIDPESGVLQRAVRLRSCGSGLEFVERHPETGSVFGGFVLPEWQRFREVITRAALCFLPVRAIGWDVALTPLGPVVVEGNIWWGPNNPHRNMDKVRAALMADASTIPCCL